MARFQPWQLDPGCYPFSATVQTRFGDLDPLGHINNVAYAALFENGRVRFNRAMHAVPREKRAPGVRWLVASVTIDYLAEGHFPDDVMVTSGISRIGTSSWDIVQAAFQGDTCIALCSSTLVQTDASGALPLSEEHRASLNTMLVKTG